MASELAPYAWGIPCVTGVTDREARFPLSARRSNQRVQRMDTRNIERWTGAAWAVDLEQVDLPGSNRTVLSETAYLDHNQEFNIADFTPGGVALGVTAAVDTTATQAAMDEASAYSTGLCLGARVVAPARVAVLLNEQITGAAGVTLVGKGQRSSRFTSSVPDYAFKFGTGDALAYGCGIADLSINMTNALGGAVHAIGTAGFRARDLYVEGIPASTNPSIFLDGGDVANIFARLDAIILNHVKTGLHLGTTGASVTTSVTASAVSVLADLVAGSVGYQIGMSCGQGSTFHGGNIENCATGIASSGLACSFFGLRSEGDNTVDVLLNSGALGHAFYGCYGWTVVTDNSGNTSNVFHGNKNISGAQYPPDTASVQTLGFTDATGAAVSKHSYGSAAPVTGSHLVGEVVFNTVPAAAGTIGWVCTTAGTPGTWKTFGAIAA